MEEGVTDIVVCRDGTVYVHYGEHVRLLELLVNVASLIRLMQWRRIRNA